MTVVTMSSERAYGPAFRKSVLCLVRDRYHDFGPTLAAEKLAQDGLHVGVQTLRQWMIADGLWIKRKERKRVHQPRPRRDRLDIHEGRAGDDPVIILGIARCLDQRLPAAV